MLPFGVLVGAFVEGALLSYLSPAGPPPHRRRWLPLLLGAIFGAVALVSVETEGDLLVTREPHLAPLVFVAGFALGLAIGFRATGRMAPLEPYGVATALGVAAYLPLFALREWNGAAALAAGGLERRRRHRPRHGGHRLG